MHKLYRLTGRYSPVFFARYVVFIMATLVLRSACAQAMLLPTTQLILGPYSVQAEIAATEVSRSYGLMHRTSLPANHGMLFVFDEVAKPCFWMRNTPLPLSIAFINERGHIVNIADMQPHSTETHCPNEPVRYALEMEQGWFRDHQIKAGARIENLPRP